MLRRLPDWRPRLFAWLKSINGTPIQPGTHDCCLFGAGAIDAQTGVDLAAAWRGRYTTFAGGQRMLRRAGYADHVDLVASCLTEDHPSTAVEGDIAAVPVGDELAIGLVQGSAIYILAETGQLMLVPMASAQRLFRLMGA